MLNLRLISTRAFPEQDPLNKDVTENGYSAAKGIVATVVFTLEGYNTTHTG